MNRNVDIICALIIPVLVNKPQMFLLFYKNRGKFKEVVTIEDIIYLN